VEKEFAMTRLIAVLVLIALLTGAAGAETGEKQKSIVGYGPYLIGLSMTSFDLDTFTQVEPPFHGIECYGTSDDLQLGRTKLEPELVLSFSDGTGNADGGQLVGITLWLPKGSKGIDTLEDIKTVSTLLYSSLLRKYDSSLVSGDSFKGDAGKVGCLCLRDTAANGIVMGNLEDAIFIWYGTSSFIVKLMSVVAQAIPKTDKSL